jgi:phenylpropionate dioxygenase-like ring-hydroxylating dioxygenase large terminal subunit
MDSPAHLAPPQAKGHLSVARLARYWYVVCAARDLGRKPRAFTLLGTPLVVFRTSSGVAALLDRCPHRNVPLSLGRTDKRTGTLECAYHGWQFASDGRCVAVPGLITEPSKAWHVPAYPAKLQDGLVWVYGRPDAPPDSEPFQVSGTLGPGSTTLIREVAVQSTLHAAIENALDVPHTAFLHKGLFRGGKKNRITAVVSRYSDRVEIEYQGEPRPPGIVGKLLSPSGGIVEHWDRFFLPSIAQVEYRLGSENHFVVTSMCTPVSDLHTKLFAVVTFRTRLPARWLKYAIEPFAMRIFRQDARILEQQTQTIRRFGGEQFVSSELDLMGPSVWRLLKQAEQGSIPADTNPVVKKVEFLA